MINDRLLSNIFQTALGEVGVKEGRPRGLRNNNPGNIEDGDFAKSEPGYCGTDGRFAKFLSLKDGISAHMDLLARYHDLHGVNTVRGVVMRWAPPTAENPNDNQYVAHVAMSAGVDPDAVIDLASPDVQRKVAIGMGEFECGRVYIDWLDDSNPEVLAYYAEAGHPEVKHDSVAWCAAFVGAILHRCHVKNSGSLAARSYLQWGVGIPQPVHGCIVVFERGPVLGHVAFFDRTDPVASGSLRCLGGNQWDEVCFESFPTSRVLGYRVPA